jgi:hypothetical protein
MKGKGILTERSPEAGAADLGGRHGLLFDPLWLDPDDDVRDRAGVRLGGRAAAAQLFTAILRSAADKCRPIWVEKSAMSADYYLLAATSDLMRMGTRPEDTGVLVVYVPMMLMKMGRVRAALDGLADRLGGPAWGSIVAGLATEALTEFDTELPEAALLDADGLAALRARFADDPAAAAEELFGPYEHEREGEDPVLLQKETSGRLAELAADPEESEEGSDDDAPEGEITEEEAAPRSFEDDAVAYIAAWARAHISPVVGRALVAYRDHGAAAASAEMKVTKAPRKTLGALARTARYAFDTVALVFDRFSGWEGVPGELRLSIAGALTEMRWAIDGNGVVVIMSAAGDTPELEEQFAAAERIEWDLTAIHAVDVGDAKVSEAPLEQWFVSATIAPPAVAFDDPVLAEAATRADDSLEAFAAIASPAIRAAIAAGRDSLDAADLGTYEPPTPEGA